MKTNNRVTHAFAATCCLCAWLSPLALFATTYYASPDGTGSGESVGNPCALMDGVTNKIRRTSNTLVLAPGHYLLTEPVALFGSASPTEPMVLMGATGNPADVILDAQGNSEVMRLDRSVLVTGITMLNGSTVNIPTSSATAASRPTSGVKISTDDNIEGLSIVSNCVVACCTNAYSQWYDYRCGAVAVYQRGLLVNSVVTNNVATKYWGGGILLQNGAEVRGCTIAGNKAVDGGGGIFCHTNAVAIVADCIISNNTATASKCKGGGVSCRVAGASLTLTNCTFYGNSADFGGGLDAVGDVRVRCMDCRFIGNDAENEGGGIHLGTAAKVMLDRCVIDGNRQTSSTYDSKNKYAAAGGGGVFAQSMSADGFISISNCVFRNNSTQARGGGFGHSWTNSVYGEIVNCVFTNNTSLRHGGGMVLREDTARADKPFVIRNCLFAFNNATGTDTDTNLSGIGGGIYLVSHANPILDSCTIVANNSNNKNTSSGVRVGGGGLYHRRTGTVTNCVIALNTLEGSSDIGTGWCLNSSAYVNSCAWPAADGVFLAANGCVNADPKFNDAANGDFTLKVSSPCRDAGVNEGWMAAASDLGGNARIVGNAVDMGCFEFVPHGFTIIFQ